MADRLPVFHIGANKSGSTTLQKALFARHPDVLNLGKPEEVKAVKAAIASIAAHCDGREKLPPPLDIDRLRAIWGSAIAGANGRVPVYSRELLILHYLYGEPDPERLPRAIVEMAGPVRVVIVVRHQIRLLESLYVHKANSTHYLSPDAWISSQPDYHAFGYRFSVIADAWSRVVGKENVGVFVFEEMVKDVAGFATRLCDFTGIDAEQGVALLQGRHENVRKTARTQAYAKLRSAFFPHAHFGRLLPAPIRNTWRNYLEGGNLEKVGLPAHWLERMRDYYREDNRKLASEFKLPLETYGYPM